MCPNHWATDLLPREGEREREHKDGDVDGDGDD
jgi:hypothetical protein